MNVCTAMNGVILSMVSADGEKLYQPAIGGRCLLTERKSPEQAGHNYVEDLAGKQNSGFLSCVQSLKQYPSWITLYLIRMCTT